MAITTYAELQTALQTWDDRADLSSIVADFITLFEAEANRRLRVRQMVTSTSLTPSSGAATLPTDYLEWIRVTRGSNLPQNMEWVEPPYLQIAYPSNRQVVVPPQYAVSPGLFTIEGSSLLVRPSDDSLPLTFLYYQKIPALSVSNTTNWLLTAHPDVYLSGGLAELNIYTEAPDKAQFWAAKRDVGLETIIRLHQFSRGQAVVRPAGPTP